MFREPGESQTKAATKVKPVPPSAVARSAIRRQPTIRYNHVHNPSIARQRSRARNTTVDHRSLFEIIRRDRDRDNTAGTAPSASRIGGGGIDQDVEADADLARAEASNRRRLESGRAILRDALSYERPGHRMRQTPESSLRHETAPSSPPRSWSRGAPPSRAARRSPMPEHMATSHMTHNAQPRRTRPRQTAPFPGAASLTPGFAPAYRFDSTTSPPEAEDSSGPRDGSGPNFADYPEPTPSSYPNRRSRRHNSSEDQIDGLGDRRRSFSPDENQWETLLTTITPDDYLPSTASTSFTSAASAMISDPSQSSTSSSTTLLTAPSSTAPSSTDTLNIYPPICDEQELSSDSDYAEYREYEEDLFNEARQAGEPPPPDPSRYSANVLEASRRASQQISEQFSRARRRSDRDLELAQMHAILDRMERREEVPDEWWAAAGLSRNLGGRVERERL
ncbi:MAG: hypothetical protein Q9187_003709 [Circinaria calcarea]